MFRLSRLAQHRRQLYTMGRQISKRKQDPKATSGSDEETPKKQKKSTAFVPFDPSVPTNTTMPDTYDFLSTPPGGVKLASYNVNSLRSAMRKGYSNYVQAEDADVLCLQETKVNEPVADAVDDKVYKYRYWAYEEKKGYAGTALFSKVKPSKVVYGIPEFEPTTRGRVITAHFKDFVLVTCYVPNSGDGLKNLESRMVFNKHMEKYLRGLQQEKKRVIWTG
jgi:AP endonuclease-1